MLMAYAAVAAFFVVALGFVFAALLAGRLIRPNKMYADKLETYECGEAPIGLAWFNFNPRFYVIALIFVIFDVEIAFIYPVATVFRQWVGQGSGWYAFAEIFLFVAILLVGLVYVWAKRDLEWVRGAGARVDSRGPQRVTGGPEVSGGAATTEEDAAELSA